jgi:hypothetical protein
VQNLNARRRGPATAAAAAAAALMVTVAVGATAAGAVRGGLASPREKEIAMELVCSVENSSLDWRAQYGHIQDIHDGRGASNGRSGWSDSSISATSRCARRPPTATCHASRTSSDGSCARGLNLLPPLRWSTYGDHYQILQ